MCGTQRLQLRPCGVRRHGPGPARVADGNPNVNALVYIAAFAPDRGESTFGLDVRVPGSLLPLALVPVPFIHGGEVGLDLYVNPLLFRAALAHDPVVVHGRSKRPRDPTRDTAVHG